MPGKVNPTQAEALTMIAVQVMANDVAVGFGGAGGYLEMNVYKPLIIFNLTHSITIMTDGCTNFRKFLVEGTKPNLKKIKEYVDRSLMLVTALAPVIGYALAAKAGAPGNLGEVGNQRRLPGTGQDDGLLIADRTQAVPEAAPLAIGPLPVGKGRRDAPPHLRHAPEQSCRPGRCEHVDGDARLALGEPQEQRLRHHHVAHPARPDHQDLTAVRCSVHHARLSSLPWRGRAASPGIS